MFQKILIALVVLFVTVSVYAAGNVSRSEEAPVLPKLNKSTYRVELSVTLQGIQVEAGWPTRTELASVSDFITETDLNTLADPDWTAEHSPRLLNTHVVDFVLIDRAEEVDGIPRYKFLERNGVPGLRPATLPELIAFAKTNQATLKALPRGWSIEALGTCYQVDEFCEHPMILGSSDEPTRSEIWLRTATHDADKFLTVRE